MQEKNVIASTCLGTVHTILSKNAHFTTSYNIVYFSPRMNLTYIFMQ